MLERNVQRPRLAMSLRNTFMLVGLLFLIEFAAAQMFNTHRVVQRLGRVEQKLVPSLPEVQVQGDVQGNALSIVGNHWTAVVP